MVEPGFEPRFLWHLGFPHTAAASRFVAHPKRTPESSGAGSGPSAWEHNSGEIPTQGQAWVDGTSSGTCPPVGWPDLRPTPASWCWLGCWHGGGGHILPWWCCGWGQGPGQVRTGPEGGGERGAAGCLLVSAEGFEGWGRLPGNRLLKKVKDVYYFHYKISSIKIFRK